MATKSLVAIVQEEIKAAKTTALGHLKSIASGFRSQKVKAAVSTALHVGPTMRKKQMEQASVHIKDILSINSDRHCINYWNAGCFIVANDFTEADIKKIGLGKLQDFGKKLREEDITGLAGTLTFITEQEAERTRKAEEAKAKRDAEKADRAAATKETAELLNAEFSEEEGLTPERVHAHLSVYFTEKWVTWEKVLGTSILPALNKLNKLVEDASAAMDKAAKEKADKEAKAAKQKSA